MYDAAFLSFMLILTNKCLVVTQGLSSLTRRVASLASGVRQGLNLTKMPFVGFFGPGVDSKHRLCSVCLEGDVPFFGYNCMKNSKKNGP